MFQSFCKIFNHQYQSFREKTHNSNDQINNQKTINKYKETPFLLQAINFIGIKDFLINQLIFAKKNSQYKITNINEVYKFQFKRTTFKQIPDYTQQCFLIDQEQNFIPIIHFKLKNQANLKSKANKYQAQNNSNQQNCNQQKPTIIYSHGNCSNIQDSYDFISEMTQIYKLNFIIYDYTGYSKQIQNSKNFNAEKHKLSEHSLYQDLKKVVQWSNLPHNKIVLWGFSLGTYSTLSVASQLKIGGIILQSPFASIYRFFSQQVYYLDEFQNDIFKNIELIQKVSSNLLIIHSKDDEIIPYWHSQSLFKRIQLQGKPIFLNMIELKKFGHNNLHQAFYSKKSNKLQQHVKIFLSKCIKQDKQQLKFNIKFQQNPQQQITNKFKIQQKKSHQNIQDANQHIPQLNLQTQQSYIWNGQNSKRKKRKLTLSTLRIQSSKH